MKATAAEPRPISAPGEPDRLASLDLIRGVAVLGILIINIRGFSGPWVAYANPAAWGDLKGANYWSWVIPELFFYLEMQNLFAMLFGVGIWLVMQKPAPAATKRLLLRRRNWTLLWFGLAHLVLLWDGDILHRYALCGFIMVPLSHLGARKLYGLAALLFLIEPILKAWHFQQISALPADQFALWREYYWLSSANTNAVVLGIFRSDWWSITTYRLADAWYYFRQVTIGQGKLASNAALMCLGMAMMQDGIPDARRSRRFYWLMGAAGLAFGFPLALWAVVRLGNAHLAATTGYFKVAFWKYIADFGLTLAWLAALVLWSRSAACGWLRRALQACGQLALSNYILQSVICTTLFYGYGLGLYGRLDRSLQLLIVLAIWILQLVISPLWLRYFRMGPLECLWRRISYGQPQPCRLKNQV
ncbi:MAG: DUF418 domain-containing protein [Leptospiraceae bacterium]|nr:DUF418 domain-containing protein [Leptospiraceae bacterium]